MEGILKKGRLKKEGPPGEKYSLGKMGTGALGNSYGLCRKFWSGGREGAVAPVYRGG